ncbi:xanthine dehydrogenase accessory protein XdhC [Ottowia sp.]|uniref:xanthine dehydrogenase accessory protein XdhC n=1 Tax=Ottowia sp. TaxID=1898956 RepID=UPI002BF84CDE|nr:xanthine dehydrogenase accessory protein XdhC [Ottowia sp.]HRN74269.1 xanthine dehydrogenase accessory protein XdhC [Ottowia sp.]HRQ01371.1 xanthine dehydrogenase accessory protein XdhC [Ottowia sp.]
MSTRLKGIAGTWLARAIPAIVVEVQGTRGSAPREAGTRMLVSAGGCEGTIGGGHLELKAIRRARRMLAEGVQDAETEHFPLGPALGQCCGGAVTLGFEPLVTTHLATWPATRPRFHLQLYGAGHVGRAIVRLLADIDCVVDWIDEREDEFPQPGDDGQPWPDHIRMVSVDAVEAEVAEARPGWFYLVLTHRHDLDMRICEQILQRDDFGFFGLIGSKSKRMRFIHHFQRRGIGDDAIARMTCPIGVPGIEGKEPEVIAIGVVAQLLQQAAPA